MTRKYEKSKMNEIDSNNEEKTVKLKRKAKSQLCEVFANRLRESLDDENMSQEDLANAIYCSTSTISDYINGIKEPKIQYLFDIAKALNVSTDYLLGNTGVKKLDEYEQAIEKYTGLSEEAVQLLKFMKKGNLVHHLNTINLIIEQELPSEKNTLILSNITAYLRTKNKENSSMYVTLNGEVMDEKTRKIMFEKFDGSDSGDNLTAVSKVSANNIIDRVLLDEIQDGLKKLKEGMCK